MRLLKGLDGYFRTNHIVRDDGHEEKIWQTCLIQDAIPFIERIPGDGPIRRVWYAYAIPKAREVVVHPGWEKYVHGFRQPAIVSDKQDEKAIEDELASWLESQGLWVDRQVRLQTGIADIIAGDMIIEVKRKLTRDAVIKAVGQVLLYGAELNMRRLVIVGRAGDGVRLARHLKHLGIELWIWRDAMPIS